VAAGAASKTGLFRRNTGTAPAPRQSATSSAPKTNSTSTTTAPAVRTTKTSLTKPTASSAQKASAMQEDRRAKEKDEKPLPHAPIARSASSAREPPVPPRNILPHPARVTAPTATSTAAKSEAIRQRTSTAGAMPSSTSGLGGTSRAQAAVGVNRINATGTGHVTGTRSISAGGSTAPRSPTAARMRASMTSGSMSALASSREIATKKKEEPFVVPAASVRSNSVASTSRVGGTVPVRSTGTTGVTGARSLAAKKNEMEVKVSPESGHARLALVKLTFH